MVKANGEFEHTSNDYQAATKKNVPYVRHNVPNVHLNDNYNNNNNDFNETDFNIWQP